MTVTLVTSGANTRFFSCMERNFLFLVQMTSYLVYTTSIVPLDRSLWVFRCIPFFPPLRALYPHTPLRVKAVDLRSFVISVGGLSQETAPKPAQKCRNRSENHRNRKITFFYIETVLNFFFQFRKIKFPGKKRKFSKSKISKF